MAAPRLPAPGSNAGENHWGAWAGRLAIYLLYHALELWDWFASIGQTEPLRGLADDMGELIRVS
jgi:hypothetical protein